MLKRMILACAVPVFIAFSVSHAEPPKTVLEPLPGEIKGRPLRPEAMPDLMAPPGLSAPGEDLSTPMVVRSVNLPALLGRKSYRLGIKFGITSPTDSININKDSTTNLAFDFDAMLNENIDMGPRFAYVTKKFNNGSTINASYGVLQFGFGARIYLTHFGEYGSTHGFFNVYLAADGAYCVASKSDTVLATSPPSFAGLLGNAGAGVELAFGPNTTGFAEARYQKSSIKDQNNLELPLDGYQFNIGARMAFL